MPSTTIPPNNKEEFCRETQHQSNWSNKWQGVLQNVRNRQPLFTPTIDDEVIESDFKLVEKIPEAKKRFKRKNPVSALGIDEIKRIHKVACQVMRIEASELLTKLKTDRVVKARAVIYYICLERGAYYMDLERYFFRDHTTVIQQHRKAIENYSSDPIYRKLISDIENSLL